MEEAVVELNCSLFAHALVPRFTYCVPLWLDHVLYFYLMFLRGARRLDTMYLFIELVQKLLFPLQLGHL